MELILWRHAQAEEPYPGLTDQARQLTVKGQAQAMVMAKWLKQRMPLETKIIVSPAVRTCQTANALDAAYEISDLVAIDKKCSDALKLIQLHDEKSMLIISHQPLLGTLASTLIFNSNSGMHIKKGAILWLTSSANYTTRIRCLLAPDLI